MKKIIAFGINLSEERKERLKKVGELQILESPSSVEDFVSKSKDADVIYSDGSYLLESLPKLKNVFVTYPYIELGVFNSEELEKNDVIISNAQGGNRDSIAEWAIYMVLDLFRKFGPRVRTKESFPFELQQSLVKKEVLVVGKGVIGKRVGDLCKSFGMNVSFFQRNDDLKMSSKDADLIINALNCNTSSKNLLDETFFMNLKKGAYYLTFSRPYTYDIEGLINSIDANIVAGAAIDCDPEAFGDTTNEFYQKCLSNSKILVTPHIAFSTNEAIANGGEIAIQNIEAFLNGKLQNVLKKK